MNPVDDQLQRLFRSAAQVQAVNVPPEPFGLETRVLAAWREGRSAPVHFWDTTVLVRGFLLACVIMGISFLPAVNVFSTATNPFADYLQLTDSTVSSDETP